LAVNRPRADRAKISHESQLTRPVRKNSLIAFTDDGKADRGGFSMRKLLLAAMVTTAFVAPANATFFGIRKGGTVTAIDGTGKSFTCHWKSKDLTYQTTGKTAFRIGKTKAAFTDLKVGEAAMVTSHVVDKAHVATRVVIKPQQPA
jgi:hypothetical protein